MSMGNFFHNLRQRDDQMECQKRLFSMTLGQEAPCFMVDVRLGAQAELHIKAGKHTSGWMRLLYQRLLGDAERFQLHALADNQNSFLQCIELPGQMADRCLNSLQIKLSMLMAGIVRHACTNTFQLLETAVSGLIAWARASFASIHQVPAPPA